MTDKSLHPCTHCARRPLEQAAFNAWADEQFGGRLQQPLLAARLGRETAYLIEFAAAGHSDLMLDQLAMVVALAYRLADGANADLWQLVTSKIQELQSLTNHEERF